MRTKYYFILWLLFSFGVSQAQETTEGAPIVIRVSSKYLSPEQEYTVSGQTLTGNKSLSVKIEILSGTSVKETENVQTDTSGKYQLKRKAPSEAGIYVARATGADGKLSNVVTFAVVNVSGTGEALAEQFDKPILLAQKGLDMADQIVSALPPSEAKEGFKAKCKDVYTKIGEVNETMGSLKSTFVRLIKATEKEPAAKAEAQQCINELDALLKQVQEETERFSWEVSQRSMDQASACEYFDLMRQAVEFISTMCEFSLKIPQMVFNFAKSKEVSLAVEQVTSDEDLQAIAGITINAALSATDPISLLIGLTLDLSAYGALKLYRAYCAEMEGTFTGKFYAEFDSGAAGKGLWEKYSMEMKGKLTLRYAKGSDPQIGFAVSGEFDGNYHDYHFWADVQAVEPLPPNMILLDQIVLNPVSGYFFDYTHKVDQKNEKKGIQKKYTTFGSATPWVPGNFRVKVKGVVKDHKLLLKFDNESLFNKIDAFNEPFRLLLIVSNPIVPIPQIKTFHFPVAPARSIFIVGMGKEGQEFDFDSLRKSEKVIAKKKFEGKRTISNGEIRLKTTLDVQINAPE